MEQYLDLQGMHDQFPLTLLSVWYYTVNFFLICLLSIFGSNHSKIAMMFLSVSSMPQTAVQTEFNVHLSIYVYMYVLNIITIH